jgi:hypothetical protein
MATPAEIRANYYRGKQRSPEAQAIAKRLEEAPRKSIEESGRISKFNEGRDPFLNTLSDAELALAPGGFSSVDMNPGARRETVRAAVEAEIPDWLPAEVENRLRERQDAMGRKLTEREKEQAEYERMAGVPTRTLLPGEDTGTLVSSATRSQSEDFEAPAREVNPTAIVKDTKQGTTREVDVESMAKEYAEEQGKRQDLLSKVRKEGTDRGAKLRAEELLARLSERGITAEPRRKDGSLDEEKAMGMLTKSTFASWDADKAARAEGERYQKDANRRLAQVRRNLRSENLTAAQFNELLDEEAELRVDIERRDQGFSKGVTGLGRSREAGRAARKAEADKLRAAALSRALAADTEAGGVEGSKTEAAKSTAAIEQLTAAILGLK